MLQTDEEQSSSREPRIAGDADVEALAEHWYEEWLRVGYSTDPADRLRAERAVRDAYGLAGRTAPRLQWVDSPVAAMERAARFGPPGFLSDLTCEVRPNPARREETEDRSIPESAWQLWDGLHVAVEWSYARAVMTAARQAVEMPERWSSLPDHFLRGQRELAKVAYYRLLEEYQPAESPLSKVLAVREDLCRSCAWVWPWGGLCLLCDRPAEIHAERVGRGMRLHREDGAAVVFRDGWSVWALNGVAVPRTVVEEPTSLDPAEIRSEEDSDVQRVMIDQFGLGRFMELIGGRTVDRIDEAAQGVPTGLRGAMLVRAPAWRRHEAMAAVSLVDLASRISDVPSRHWIRVPPEMTSVREAVAWTFGVKAEDYAPSVET